MALYEIGDAGLQRHEPSAFADLGLLERVDLQRLLREDISALGEELLVVAEEFGEWEEARRRIDLLAIDKSGRLVVVELKRTEDGGHMELQALRYAAMVSSMLFEDVVDAYRAHLAKGGSDAAADAAQELASFLDSSEGEEEPVISSEVRIVLVSANFGRELMTAVLWLNRFEGMDIRCVRLVPYRLGDRTLLDVQQVVPLPEAADYQIRVRRKDQQQERARTQGRDFTRFQVILDGQPLPDENKRNAIRVMVTKLIHRGIHPEQISELLGPTRFRSVDGELEEAEEITAGFATAGEPIDPARWFLDHPFHADGKTWILKNQWGKRTESTLAELAEAFPDTCVTFRRAQP